MKDYFDLWVLARHSNFEGEVPREFLVPPLSALATGQGFSSAWNHETWDSAE